MVVYLDVLFITNLISNYIIIALSSAFGSIFVKKYRIFLGALVGAIYAVFTFFNTFSFLNFALIKILFCVVITLISFGKKNLIKNSILILIVSFIFAGAIMGIFYLSTSQDYMMINGVPYLDISFNILLSVFILTFVSLGILHKGLYKNKTELTRNILIKIGERQLKISAFCDTGNQLCDNITGKPIIIVEADELAKVLPQSLMFLTKEDCLDYITYLNGSFNNNLKIRFVPFTSIGNKSSSMIVFSPDKIYDNENKEINALIGISYEKIKLSGANAIIGGAI